MSRVRAPSPASSKAPLRRGFCLQEAEREDASSPPCQRNVSYSLAELASMSVSLPRTQVRRCGEQRLQQDMKAGDVVCLFLMVEAPAPFLGNPLVQRDGRWLR